MLWHHWLGIRTSLRSVKNWVMRCWRGYLSGVKCKWFAYGPALGRPQADALDACASTIETKPRLELASHSHRLFNKWQCACKSELSRHKRYIFNLTHTFPSPAILVVALLQMAAWLIKVKLSVGYIHQVTDQLLVSNAQAIWRRPVVSKSCGNCRHVRRNVSMNMQQRWSCQTWDTWHRIYRPDVLPVTQPTASKHWMELSGGSEGK